MLGVGRFAPKCWQNVDMSGQNFSAGLRPAVCYGFMELKNAVLGGQSGVQAILRAFETISSDFCASRTSTYSSVTSVTTHHSSPHTAGWTREARAAHTHRERTAQSTARGTLTSTIHTTLFPDQERGGNVMEPPGLKLVACGSGRTWKGGNTKEQRGAP